jgi:hypothetical protein
MAIISALVPVPYSERPALKAQWEEIKGSLKLPQVKQVMNQIETDVANRFRCDGFDPNPVLDSLVLKNNADLLFKRLAEHYHYQFRETKYPNIPMDYYSYVPLHHDFLEAITKANTHFLQSIKNNDGTDAYAYARGFTVIPTPSEKASFQKLKRIHLRANQISWIPSNWFQRFTLIQVIDLKNNKLTSIPDSIGDLKNLRSLNLGANNIEKLPESIGELTNLSNLYLSWNKLETLPESIGNLTNLKILDLDNNQLRILPQSMKDLKLRNFSIQSVQFNYHEVWLAYNGVLFMLFGKIEKKSDFSKSHSFVDSMNESDLPWLLPKMKVFREYECKSQLAKLCQIFITNRDGTKLQNTWKLLRDSDRSLIEKNLGELVKKRSQDNQFRDAIENLGCYAIALAIWEKYNNLTDGQRRVIFEKVHELAGKPDTPDRIQWGEEHAFEHILRLVDAMDGF